ncbi:MAG: hypothetical protein F4Y04_04650, partial [Chloroflexi bacterium]|nr:hypothetical protein [Chloroflexota bacterium]
TDEDTAYTFEADDFNFMDSDSDDTLASVKITTLPASGKGTLALAGTTIGSSDLPQTVTKAELDDDDLAYAPPDDMSGDDFASFMFKVNDGTDDSVQAYTMTIDVDADTTGPVLSTATVDETLLVLTYDEDLDTASTPASTAFEVTVASSTRALAANDPVTVSGATVTLTLASAVASGETVTVSYTVPSSNPIQDDNGNDAAGLTNQAVTNNTPLIRVGYEFDAYEVAEDAGVRELCVIIYVPASGVAPRSFTLEANTADGTATAGDDYVARRGLDLAFSSGDTTVCQTVEIVDDDIAESDETLTVTLEHRSGSPVVFQPNVASATVTITDDGDTQHPAEGAPAITGTAQVNETLTAGQGNISDDNGLPDTFPDDYGFQWIRVDSDGTSNPTDITGATSSTYTLASADLGKKIQVRVTFTDDDGNDEELTSAAYPSGTDTVSMTIITPAVSQVAVTSTPQAASDTYGQGETIRFTVTFSAAVEVSASRPHFEFALGPSGNTVNKDAAYESGAGTTALVFAYTVAAGDMDPNGIWIGDQGRTLMLDAGEYIRGVGGGPAATLTHNELGSQSGHKVDGSLTLSNNAPMASNGTVTTREDAAYTFDASDFNFSDTDSGDTLASVKVTTLPASGKGTLALDGTAIASSNLPQTVTKAQLDANNLVYTPPANENGDGFTSFRFRVNDGTDDSAQAYTMTIDVDALPQNIIEAPSTNAAPGFPASTVMRQVAENTPPGTGIGDALPGATDGDGDTPTYTLEGADAASFAFDAATRRLSTREGVVYDHEAQASYTVTLRAEDGEASATLAVTIEITDVDEPPIAPAAPIVRPAEGETSLQADWTAPDNAGRPSITGYDLRYRIQGTSSWSDGPQGVAGLRATLAGLAVGTTYEVQVRAGNAEGRGAWSMSGLGMIELSGPVPKAWLARFGRTVAEQVIDAVDTRLAHTPVPGLQVQVAGRSLQAFEASGTRVRRAEEDRDAEEDRAQLAAMARRFGDGQGDKGRRSGAGMGHEPQDTYQSGSLSTRGLLAGTAFSFTDESSSGSRVSVWGRGAISQFNGRTGTVSIDGEVDTLMLGADWSWDSWITGVLFSHSRGDGEWRGEDEGRVASTLNGLWPYGRYRYSQALSLWGLAGYGQGEMDLKPEGRTSMEADIDLMMGAAGLRSIAMQAPNTGGLELAVVSDVMAVRTESNRTAGLASSEADVTRIRLGLEGTWQGIVHHGANWVPSIEVGIRHDDGDAETGFGADLGAGLTYDHEGYGLMAEIRARGLITHEASGFENVGLAGSLAWDPGPSTDRGPRLTLSQTIGAQASGGMDALLGRATMAGLTTRRGDDEPDSEAGRRQLELRAGYGFGIYDGRLTLTPELGLAHSPDQRQYRVGWRMEPAGSPPGSVQLRFDAIRKESSADEAEPEHEIILQTGVQF